MNYIRVLQQIGSIGGNPTLKDNGKDLAKIAFISAISTLIKEGNYDKSDIPGFVKVKTDVDFGDAGDTEDLNGLSIFKILNYFLPPGTDKKVIITEKEPSELNKMSSIETLQPTDNDLFIYHIGNTLYGLAGSSSPVFNLGTDTLIMEYIEDINDNNWLDSTDLQNATNYQLSYNFMQTAISMAGKALLGEATK